MRMRSWTLNDWVAILTEIVLTASFGTTEDNWTNCRSNWKQKKLTAAEESMRLRQNDVEVKPLCRFAVQSGTIHFTLELDSLIYDYERNWKTNKIAIAT